MLKKAPYDQWSKGTSLPLVCLGLTPGRGLRAAPWDWKGFANPMERLRANFVSCVFVSCVFVGCLFPEISWNAEMEECDGCGY
jgi:hypothetical protein